ncbi:MAG: MerR family transcriptional regulator [Chitinophagaceae bacterium]|nr:MAG: MerR family transcriptional regulator [Chitinophagaceae bacterium]
MSDDRFQIAFDFFGEPEKPDDAGKESVPAKKEEPDVPLKAPAAAAQVAEEPTEVYFPDPLDLQPASGLTEYLSGAPVPEERRKSTRGRKSQKAMAAEVALVQVPPDEELFKKQYYGIREVSEMFAVNPSLLRYWETSFGMQLRKNRKGDRFFTPQDIKTVQLIHDLLRRRKFTIDGARDFLKKNKGADQRYELIQSLQKVRKFLLELKAHL